MVFPKFSSRLSIFYVPITTISYLFHAYAGQNYSRNYSDSSHIIRIGIIIQMSHRSHRVSANLSKLQRLYYGSDSDEPTPSASGTWLSPLRHTYRRESSDAMEEMLLTPTKGPSGPRTVTVISTVKTQIQTLVAYLKQFNQRLLH